MFSCGRKITIKTATLADFAFNTQLSAMALHNMFNDSQPQTGPALAILRHALARAFNPVEALCKTRQMLRRNAWAIIRYRHVYADLIGIPANRDTAAGRGMPHRIKD